jgi:hypothetical protein
MKTLFALCLVVSALVSWQQAVANTSIPLTGAGLSGGSGGGALGGALLLEDNASFILLEDGLSHLCFEGAAC